MSTIPVQINGHRAINTIIASHHFTICLVQSPSRRPCAPITRERVCAAKREARRVSLSIRTMARVPPPPRDTSTTASSCLLCLAKYHTVMLRAKKKAGTARTCDLREKSRSTVSTKTCAARVAINFTTPDLPHPVPGVWRTRNPLPAHPTPHK